MSIKVKAVYLIYRKYFAYVKLQVLKMSKKIPFESVSLHKIYTSVQILLITDELIVC